MTFEDIERDIKKGLYQHYKGGLYKVLYVAEHTETGEFDVVYQDSNEKTWVRPVSSFCEKITVPRFTKIAEVAVKLDAKS